jgi:hypothetical protein
MHVSAEGSRCQSGCIGDFFVWNPLDDMQDKHSPCAVRESRNCPLEVNRALYVRLVSHCGQLDWIREVVVEDQTTFPASSGAQAREVHVDRYAVEPRTEGGFRPETRQAFPRAHENILRKLGRALPVCREPQAKGEDTRSVVAVDRCERSRVALARAAHLGELVTLEPG